MQLCNAIIVNFTLITGLLVLIIADFTAIIVNCTLITGLLILIIADFTAIVTTCPVITAKLYRNYSELFIFSGLSLKSP